MIQFSTHLHAFIVLPALVIEAGECENCDCPDTHWPISLSWFVWSLEVYL